MNVLSRKGVSMRPRRWTETAIKQAFDNFVIEHNRLPTREEMYQKHNGKFPQSSSVKLSLGITLNQYLKTNYTTYFNKKQTRVYGAMSEEYWIEDFKKQYIKYNKPTEREYNKMRCPHTPNTQTLKKFVGVTTWLDLLKHCGFIEEKIKLRGVLVFEESPENYEILNNRIQKFLRNLK